MTKYEKRLQDAERKTGSDGEIFICYHDKGKIINTGTFEAARRRAQIVHADKRAMKL